jgi:hypothetical protein
MKLRTCIGSGMAACAGRASGAALAGVSVGVNLGVPVAPVYAAPPPPPPVVYQPARLVIAPAPAFVVGWHGDRYRDGYRYWDRRDWYAHHGGGYGPRHW